MTDDFKRATANLQKAVPLMMKNHVSVTPANYALWYAYVDNAIPQLNIDLDNIIQDAGVCSPAASAQLYNNYIAHRSETDMNQLRESVEVLVNEIASSVTDTLSDTSDFSKLIDKSFSNLSRVENEAMSMDEVLLIVRQLLSESKEIKHSTRFLGNQLETATKEINRLKAQLAEVQQDALFDGLTSLYNRRSFDQDINALYQSEQKLCLILADVDHFKAFNDNYGHLLGDAVLKGLARTLQRGCRDGISAYRFGGEEFALIVPNKPLRIARQFAETMRRATEKLSVKDRRSGKHVGNITISLGVAELQEKESVESLIERADGLLYEAKSLGRNRVMPL